MTREEALKLLKLKVSNANLIKHSLAVEAVMKFLAKHFGEDGTKWSLTGLLHDIDYDETKDDMLNHSLIGAEMLEKIGIDKEICQAIKVHNDKHGIAPQSLLEKALYVTDPLTGLITAAVLVLPSKKLADLETDSIVKRFKEKAFAKGAKREIIAKCQEYLNLSLEQFSRIGLTAMQDISEALGLK